MPPGVPGTLGETIAPSLRYTAPLATGSTLVGQAWFGRGTQVFEIRAELGAPGLAEEAFAAAFYELLRSFRFLSDYPTGHPEVLDYCLKHQRDLFDPEVYLHLATRLHQHQRNYRSAGELYRIALDYNVKQGGGLDSLQRCYAYWGQGLCQAALGDYPAAASNLEAVLAMANPSGESSCGSPVETILSEANFQLAGVYSQLGQLPKSLACLRKILRPVQAEVEVVERLLLQIKDDPLMKNIREYPAFLRLIEDCLTTRTFEPELEHE
jgi:tetratricopeptide (TPR) repeat protein